MEYINETKSQILKRKLLESIKIIKENLYDANGNMINDNTIDVEDKDKCIRLLQDYDEKLRKLENNEPVYSKITCLKEKTLPYNIVDDVVHKRKKSYDINIPSKGIVEGVYTCFEYSDGTYHDVIVLYKGFSSEYNTEFICYYDISNNHVLVSPLFMKNGKIIRGICTNEDMINDFSTQFFNNELNIQNLKDLPAVINYYKIKHYEEYVVNVAISGKRKVNVDNKDTSNLFKYNNDNNDDYLNNHIYHYKAKFADEEKYEKVIIELKEVNPNLIIYGEKCGWYDSSKNSFKDDCYIISISVPFDMVNEPNTIFRRGQYSYIQRALSILTEDDYEKIKTKYNCDLEKCDDEQAVRMFVSYLNKNNPNSQISYEYDEENKLFRLVSLTPFSSINYGDAIKNASDRIYSKFRIDKNGYILTTELDIIKYECNDNLELYKTLDVYMDDDILNKLNSHKDNHDNNNINNNESSLYTENDDTQTFLSMKKELELLRQQYLNSQQEIKELKEQIEYYKQIFGDRNEEHKKNL